MDHKVKIWAATVPTGPVAACGTWTLGEDIARALSATGNDIYRVTVDDCPLFAEFCAGQRTPAGA